MKIITRIHHLIPGLACLWFALTSVSCQTTSSPPKTTRVPMSMTGTKWVKVSSQPPTYYPRGVAADCKTDHWSGEWIYTGDEQGSRYFIPLHGLGGTTRQNLVHEAMAARSDREMKQIAAGDDEIRIRNIRNMTLFGPPVLIFGLAGGLVGGDLSKVDVHELEKDWDAARNPQ